MLRQRRLIAALSSAVLAACGLASAAAPANAATSAARPAASSHPGSSQHPAVSGKSVIEGTVSDVYGTPLAGVSVSVCETSPTWGCWSATTDGNGFYEVGGLAAGTYSVDASAPPLLNGANSPIALATSSAQVANLVLLAPSALPPGVTFPGTSGAPPAMYYGSSHNFTAAGRCANGTASFTVMENGVVIASGPMPETPPGSGTYAGVIPPFAPYDHGYAQVTVTVHCPGGTTQQVPFPIYLDPSGTVISPAGLAIGGATVTLLTAPTAAGPFTPVPNGSTIMSPANRVNPMVTAADGLYGWDVTPGFYEVQAQKTGCVAPASPPTPVAVSAVLQIPPAVTGLLLTLDCTGSPATSITSAGSATFTAGVGGNFALTATGSPAPTWTESGALPAGVNFVPQPGGKASLVVAASTAPGVTTFTATAGNGVGSNVAQFFTLTVNPANGPVFTSASSATFAAGTGGTFTVSTSSNPTAKVTESGALPAGVAFTPGSNGNGTLVVGASAAAGATTVTFTATAGTAVAVQSFTFTVLAPAPAITSWPAAQFTLAPGTSGTFTVTTAGIPTPSLSATGALPPGVTFTAHENGTATIAVSQSAPAGSFGFTITAANGVSPAATQPFVLTKN